MHIKILCTLGPASLKKGVIGRLEDLGVDLFRLNLSHTRIEDLENQINFIRSATNIPICLDTEGAQIRTGTLQGGELELEENDIVNIPIKIIKGIKSEFNLYPENIVEELNVGDILSIDFNSALLQVSKKNNDALELVVLIPGVIGSNKAVTVNRSVPLKSITGKDLSSIELGITKDVNHFALSFANNSKDVENFRKVIGEKNLLISKIESAQGLLNKEDIINLSDAVLIDRGDLSREIAIQKIPKAQREIIKLANKNKTEVYVATNLLESMIENSSPTRAEVNDVYNLLESGANGLVLAAETAIGKHPIACVSMIKKLISEFNSNTIISSSAFEDQFPIPPHGNNLVKNIAGEDEINQEKDLRKIIVDDSDLIDAEQIALGTFSPIESFMSKDELINVLENNKLLDGNIWTMPIILQIDKSKNLVPNKGERIILSSKTLEDIAFLDVNTVYEIDIHEIAKKWFGTDSSHHPGVKKLLSKGNLIVSGKVMLIKRNKSAFRKYELTPHETRYIFNQRNWSRVVGFHTRNPPHMAHEYIQLKALSDCEADGLFISPVMGSKKSGDFLTEIILKSYQMMIDKKIYPEHTVMLGGFNTYSRYSGPREAVFTAICRKNFGCSHFIIGRDHTGVQDLYKEDESRKYFEKLGDLGINLVFFDNVGFDLSTKKFTSKLEQGVKEISGSEIRDAFINEKKLPNWYMREDIQQMILSEIKKGKKVFY